MVVSSVTFRWVSAMATGLDTHIEKIEGQPARLVRLPRIRVTQIVMDYLAHGWSPDEMCRHHLHLTPAEAHAAMTYAGSEFAAITHALDRVDLQLLDGQ